MDKSSLPSRPVRVVVTTMALVGTLVALLNVDGLIRYGRNALAQQGCPSGSPSPSPTNCPSGSPSPTASPSPDCIRVLGVCVPGTGGGGSPTPSGSATASPSGSATPSGSPTASGSPSPTSTASQTPTATASPSPSPTGSSIQVPSSITIRYRARADAFGGAVRSGQNACEENRRVTLKKRRPGKDRVIGRTTTSDTGAWQIGNQPNPRGTYYAKVRQRVVPANTANQVFDCQAARSRNLRP